MTPQANGTR